MVRAWLIVPLSIAGSATSPTSPEAPGVVSALLHRKREPAARAAAGRVRVAARSSMFLRALALSSRQLPPASVP